MDLLLLAGAAFVLFFGLWGGSLSNSDDVLYTVMARNGWRSGELLAPQWHGTVLFEKPPVLFLALGLSGGIFGFTDFAMRAPAALAGLGCLVLLFPLSRLLGLPRLAARLAVIALATSFTFVFQFRRPLVDPIFALMALLFLVTWLRSQRAHETGGSGLRWAVAAGVFFGLAILTKWLFVILPGMAALGWHLAWPRRPHMKHAAIAGVTGLAVAAPWHVLMSLRHGAEFWQTYAGYHVLDRASRTIVGADTTWLYWRTLSELDLFFVLLVVLSILGLALARGNEARGLRAIWLMALLAFLPLQAADTRLSHYLVSLTPLLGLAAGAGWATLVTWRRPVLGVFGIFAVFALSASTWPDVVEPDYSPGTQVACVDSTTTPPVFVVNAYNVAATWYCDAPVPLYTDDQRFRDVQHSIAMMRQSGAVRFMEPTQLIALLRSKPEVWILTRPGYGEVLRDRLQPDPRTTIRRSHDADWLVSEP